MNGETKQKGVKRRLSESPERPRNKRNVRSVADGVLMSVPVNGVNDKVRCKLCHQKQTENVTVPPNAEPECIVLTNESLANIYTDQIHVITHNLTNYGIYDENGHMCSLDSGIMERNVAVYLTGYVKPIYDNSPNVDGGIAAMELGPILEWWLSSYDGGSHAIVGISTEYADYLLIEPHVNYKKYMTSVTEKIHLSRLVIECMLSSEYDDPTYEDVLDCVTNSINPATDNKYTEEDLIAHAQFVLDQVIDYDSYDTHHLPLAETQCIEMLTQFSGAVKSSKEASRGVNRNGHRRGVKPDIIKREFSKATTTELVQDVFENMFAAQLDIDNKENEATPNEFVMAEIDETYITNTTYKKEDKKSINENEFMWNGHKLCKSMFVLCKRKASSKPTIGRIEHVFKFNMKKMAHIILFLRSEQTVLGEASDNQEIFALKKCVSIDIKCIVGIADVKQKIPSDNWFNLGNSKLQDLLEPVNRDDKNNSFFFQFEYDDEFGRFEYLKSEKSTNNKKPNYCPVCESKGIEKSLQNPKVLDFVENYEGSSYYFHVYVKHEMYKVGNFIYLESDIFSKARRSNFVNAKPFVRKELNQHKTSQALKIVDETTYPEYYRKTLENTMRGSNETTPKPFEIAEILAIFHSENNANNVKLCIRRMYRAEQIPLDNNDKNADMNMLLWSKEEFIIECDKICGKCYVAYINNIQNPLVWCNDGPDRFYFKKEYDFISGTFAPENQLPSTARLTGKEAYVKYDYKYVDEKQAQYIPSYKKIKPLKGLDIFAGCGGLSRGLEDSGLVKTQWAIECDDKAAFAFQLNNPKTTVFVEDCNHLLKLVMSGNKTNSKNQKIPQRGEVDFICGGPPCQGFSGMNRFNSGEYSLFKNSLIVSFLSYIDFYRPKYFVMENVRNFVSFKKSMVLKLTLRCITRMGYQCTFGILQAGNFGVPQTRRRLIIMAAAPGEQLPLYPEPLHVFNRRGSSLTVQVGEKKFRTNCKYDETAPMRTVTVYDAWSDLPEISNGAVLEEIPYKSTPITHLQKLLRFPDNCFSESILTDHICKDMSPLVQARMALIPTSEGSDWRDLPNVEVKLSDGTLTSKLIYTQNDIRNGKGQGGALRGVCPCASGNKCNPQDRQNNTIIPWCLPHTGNRHNNWAGLYGRIAWTGFCSTTITNPEPMGKQGRVLHPAQHRVVSVRECARTQGFNDSFLFNGPIINKHRQIGNAVPPPMGKALGHEIIKAIDKKGDPTNLKIVD